MCEYHIILALPTLGLSPIQNRELRCSSTASQVTDRLSRINELLHDWVINHTDLPVPPTKQDVTSPYDADLVKAGYMKEGDFDSDEDDLLVITP